MGICHEEIPTLNLKCCSAKEDYFTYQLKLTQSQLHVRILTAYSSSTMDGPLVEGRINTFLYQYIVVCKQQFCC
jgi:hypothetical protein